MIQRSQQAIQKSSKRLRDLEQNELHLIKQLEEIRKAKRQETRLKTNQELSHVGRLIEYVGFPSHNLAILVGAILDAKLQLEMNKEVTVNHFLSLYQEFAEHNQIPESLQEDFLYASQEEDDSLEEVADDATVIEK